LTTRRFGRVLSVLHTGFTAVEWLFPCAWPDEEIKVRPIGHMQTADSPGHPEPGTDEIHFVYCFWNLGQNGWIGCEYRPLARTEAWLGWLQLFNRRYAFCS